MAEKRLRSPTLARFLILWILVILFLSAGKFFHFDPQLYQNLLGHFPLWLSAVIFIVLCVGITTFIWVGPKDIFLIVAALLYGPYVSTLLVYIVEMISLPIFFMLSRKLGRGYVEKKLKGGIKDGTTQSPRHISGVSFSCGSFRSYPTGSWTCSWA